VLGIIPSVKVYEFALMLCEEGRKEYKKRKEKYLGAGRCF